MSNKSNSKTTEQVFFNTGRIGLTPNEEKRQIALQKQNQKAQQIAAIAASKRSARESSLAYSPKSKFNAAGMEEPLTAKEKITEAEIIYKWLIKDL